MGNLRMPWFLTIIVLIFRFHSFSEANHSDKKLPSAVVVGTVYCDTCFQQDLPKTSHFISGALVAVECEGTNSNPSFYEEVKTNEHGEFRVHLPFSVSKHVKKIKECSVKLISSSEPYCSIASTSTATASSSLHLKSTTEGTHIFSAGFFTFKPLKQPTLCNQKPSTHNSKEFNSREFSTPIPGIPYFRPATEDPLETSELSKGVVPQQTFFPPIPGLPPNPFRRLPMPFQPPYSMFPPNPFLRPPSIVPPNPLQPPPSMLPPNPLQPPPSILPPNPLQPPPSILPPNPFQPPLSPPSMFPPNPFQPPPLMFPPNPFQPAPSSPPSMFPPNPFQPPPLMFPPNPFQPAPSSPPSMFPPNPFPPGPGLSPPSPGMFPPNPFPPGSGLSPPSPGMFPPNPFPPGPGLSPPSPGMFPPNPFPPGPGLSPPSPGIPAPLLKKTSP